MHSSFIHKALLWLDHQALLAQWIARWTSNPKVAGSSPAQGNLLLILFWLLEVQIRPSCVGQNSYACIFQR